jgi:hypothetical protein
VTEEASTVTTTRSTQRWYGNPLVWVGFAAAALLVALALPRGGIGLWIRVSLAVAVMTMFPGWLVVRRIRGDGAVRFFAAAMVSFAIYAGAGFVLQELGDRWLTGTVLGVLIVSSAIAAGLGGLKSTARGAPVSWALAVLLAVAIGGSAGIVHLVLGSPPVESAVAMQIVATSVHNGDVKVGVATTRVGTSAPNSMSLILNGRAVAEASVPEGVHISQIAGMTQNGQCPHSINVVASNGAYVSPITWKCVTTP